MGWEGSCWLETTNLPPEGQFQALLWLIRVMITLITLICVETVFGALIICQALLISLDIFPPAPSTRL